MQKPILNIFLASYYGLPFLLIILFINLLKQDNIINKKNSAINNSYFKPLLIFTCYLGILSIYKKDTFALFNNIFYVINSITFLLAILTYNSSYKSWINDFAFFCNIIICLLLFVEVVSVLLFAIASSPIYNQISNSFIKEYLYNCAPGTPRRMAGILGNENVMGYVVLFGFFLPLISLNHYKGKKTLTLSIIFWLFSFISIFLTGSRGALFTLILSSAFLIIVLYPLSKKIGIKYFKIYKKFLFTFISIIILMLLYINLINTEFNLEIRKYFFTNILRFENIFGFGKRTILWSSLLSIDKKQFIFGLSDLQIQNALKPIYLEGSNNFVDNFGRFHNIYLQLLISYGIFGLIAFVGFICNLLYKAIKSIKRLNLNSIIILTILITQLSTFLIGGFLEQLPLFSNTPHALLFMMNIAAIIVTTSQKDLLNNEPNVKSDKK